MGFYNKEDSDRKKLLKQEEKLLDERRKISKLPLKEQKIALEELNKKYQLDVPKKEIEKVIKEDTFEKRATLNIESTKKEITEEELEVLKIQEKIKRAQGLLFKADSKLEKDYNIKDDDDDSSYNTTSSSFRRFHHIGIIIPIIIIAFGISMIFGLKPLIFILIVIPLIPIIFMILNGNRHLFAIIPGVIGIGIVLTVGWLIISQVTKQISVMEEDETVTVSISDGSVNSTEMINIERVILPMFDIIALGIIVMSAFGLIRIFE